MVRDIVVVEDRRLRSKCPRVPKVDDSTRKLIDDMVDTMREAPGIGLAAPQVGVLLRVIVAEVDDQDRKSTRLNSSHHTTSRMPSSA